MSIKKNQCPVCGFDNINDNCPACPQCNADLTCFDILNSIPEQNGDYPVDPGILTPIHGTLDKILGELGKSNNLKTVSMETNMNKNSVNSGDASRWFCPEIVLTVLITACIMLVFFLFYKVTGLEVDIGDASRVIRENSLQITDLRLENVVLRKDLTAKTLRLENDLRRLVDDDRNMMAELKKLTQRQDAALVASRRRVDIEIEKLWGIVRPLQDAVRLMSENHEKHFEQWLTEFRRNNKRLLEQLGNAKNSFAAIRKALSEQRGQSNMRLEEITEHGKQLRKSLNKQIVQFDKLDKYSKHRQKAYSKEREQLLKRLDSLDEQIRRLTEKKEDERFLGLF